MNIGSIHSILLITTIKLQVSTLTISIDGTLIANACYKLHNQILH